MLPIYYSHQIFGVTFCIRCSYFIPFELFLFGFAFQWLLVFQWLTQSTNGSDTKFDVMNCLFLLLPFDVFWVVSAIMVAFFYLGWFLCQILSGLLFQLVCCFYQFLSCFLMCQEWWYIFFSYLFLCCDVPLNFGFFWCCFSWKVDMLLVFLYIVGFALFQFRDPLDVVNEFSETLSTWISLPFSHWWFCCLCFISLLSLFI